MSDPEAGRAGPTKVSMKGAAPPPHGANDVDDDDTGGPTVSVPVIICMSIASSVSLILVNKVIIHSFGFKFVMSLTTLHFLCTWGGMEVVAAAKVFAPCTTMPTTAQLAIAAAGVLSIVFMNLSLRFNSVGTYQMFKLACIPCVMLIQYLQSGTVYSAKRMASLAVLLLGVGVATVADVEMQFTGLVMGVIAVVTTARFQTWQGSKQKQYGVSPMQLLHLVAKWQALITFVAACIFEPDVLSHSFETMEVLLILVSGGIAISVNLCSMGLIGKTSAVVYQVVGHTKTCLILLGGYMFFPTEASSEDQAKNLIGVAIAMGGVFWYTYLRLNNQ